jgi:transposase
MATFCVCSRCGNVQETDVLDQIPESWQRSIADLYCPSCSKTDGRDAKAAGDILDEDVIHSTSNGTSSEDSLDKEFCEICPGPCRGH